MKKYEEFIQYIEFRKCQMKRLTAERIKQRENKESAAGGQLIGLALT